MSLGFAQQWLAWHDNQKSATEATFRAKQIFWTRIAALAGPVYLVVDQLTPMVRLQKPTGLTKSDAPMGDPYVFMGPAGQAFGSGQTRTVVLTFGNPLGHKVRYHLRVLDGAGTP